MRVNYDFFKNRNTIDIAKDLIGKVLVLKTKDNNFIKGIINETEAYTEDDEASHTFNGKNKKNSVMYYRFGHLYVYFTYGMYYCCNIVTNEKNKGDAVLIRSVFPIEGLEIMKKNRIKFNKKNKIRFNNINNKNLTNGPAKVCIAYGISLNDNGLDLLSKNSHIYLEDLGYIPKKIEITKRIGISKAKELKRRFYTGDFYKKN